MNSWDFVPPDYFWPCHKPKKLGGRTIRWNRGYITLVLHYCSTLGCDNFARAEVESEKWLHSYGHLFGYYCKKCTEERFDGKCTVIGSCIVT